MVRKRSKMNNFSRYFHNPQVFLRIQFRRKFFYSALIISIIIMSGIRSIIFSLIMNIEQLQLNDVIVAMFIHNIIGSKIDYNKMRTMCTPCTMYEMRAADALLTKNEKRVKFHLTVIIYKLHKHIRNRMIATKFHSVVHLRHILCYIWVVLLKRTRIHEREKRTISTHHKFRSILIEEFNKICAVYATRLFEFGFHSNSTMWK